MSSNGGIGIRRKEQLDELETGSTQKRGLEMAVEQMKVNTTNGMDCWNAIRVNQVLG